MLETKNMYRELGISDEVFAYGKKIEESLKERFEEIDKVDQETAQRLKRELKSKDSESGSSTNLKSNSFVKYEKNLKSITDSVDKNKKVKKETMYEMELDLIESKLDNLIGLLKEEKNALLAIKAKKENKKPFDTTKAYKFLMKESTVSECEGLLKSVKKRCQALEEETEFRCKQKEREAKERCANLYAKTKEVIDKRLNELSGKQEGFTKRINGSKNF